MHEITLVGMLIETIPCLSATRITDDAVTIQVMVPNTRGVKTEKRVETGV
jgi:hypothetical protein